MSGIAVGEGGVWVAGWHSRGGLVTRLDQSTALVSVVLETAGLATAAALAS